MKLLVQCYSQCSLLIKLINNGHFTLLQKCVQFAFIIIKDNCREFERLSQNLNFERLEVFHAHNLLAYY